MGKLLENGEEFPTPTVPLKMPLFTSLHFTFFHLAFFLSPSINDFIRDVGFNLRPLHRFGDESQLPEDRACSVKDTVGRRSMIKIDKNLCSAFVGLKHRHRMLPMRF
jgi:hypothetical protein